MVRLVFRPYTQVRRSICTSESLQASIRLSSDFTLLKHSSPSFGSQQMCSYSNLSRSRIGRSMMRPTTAVEGISLQPQAAFTFIMPEGFDHPKTRTHVRLLGPCFKTGRMKPYDRQQPWHNVCTRPNNGEPRFKRTARSPPWSTTHRERRGQPKRACAATPLSNASSHTTIYNTSRSQPPSCGAPRSLPTAVDALRWEMRPTTTSDPRRRSIQIRTTRVPAAAKSESQRSIANSMRFPPNGFTYY